MNAFSSNQDLPLVLSKTEYKIDSELVEMYSKSTKCDSFPFSKVSVKYKNTIPPTAILTLSLRDLVSKLELPHGTLHTGQEVEFINPANLNSVLYCTTTLLQNSVRKSIRILMIGLSVKDENKTPILRGKTTLFTSL